MGKIGGLALVAVLGLTGCASSAVEPASAPTSAPAQRVAPSPSVTLSPEFSDDSAQARYLAGVKKALNAWRDGVIPSDAALLEGAAQACQLFAQGKTYMEIAALAGSTNLQQENGAAVAVYASRNLCTKYNTDN